jgi:hypothetical protein
MPTQRSEDHLGKYQYDLLEVGYSKKEAMAIAIKMATRKNKKKKDGKKRGRKWEHPAY